MTTVTVTAATAGADLLDELRSLLARHDGAATHDEVRALADDVSTVLRRARGRLARLTRKAKPAEPKPEPTHTQQSAPQTTQQKPATFALPRPQDAPPLSTWRRSPLDDAASLQARKERSPEDYQAAVLRTEIGTRAYEALAVPTPAPPMLEKAVPAPTRVVPAPCRFSRVRRVLAVLAVLWVAVVAGVVRRVRRFAAEERQEEICIVCGPGCCSPVLGRHTSCPPAGGTVVAR